MQRIKCIVSYDGSGFSGYQVQPGKRTVQLELEQALSAIHKGTTIRVSASGRTDAGVHAMGQVIHFDTPLTIPAEKWPVVLNQRLPDDVVIRSASLADPSFHARFSAAGKQYRYRVDRSPVKNPFNRQRVLHDTSPLSISAIQEAAGHFTGTHCFTSFCAAKTDVVDHVRTIHRFDVVEEDNELLFIVEGTGFLYNMVRIMVGTLLDVGRGKFSPADIPMMLRAEDRSAAGKTAPAEGLYLWKVDYPDEMGSKS